MQGGGNSGARFMDVDGKLSEVLGEDGGIKVMERDQGDNMRNNSLAYQSGSDMEGEFENVTVVIDTKRRRVNNENITETSGEVNLNGPVMHDGSKNLIEAGSVLQARLEQ